jgi:hypothetical protein
MAMYSFIFPFWEVTFCGVLSYISDKSGCVEHDKGLQNTVCTTTDKHNFIMHTGILLAKYRIKYVLWNVTETQNKNRLIANAEKIDAHFWCVQKHHWPTANLSQTQTFLILH